MYSYIGWIILCFNLQFKNLLNSLDPFEHDEDDSDDKDNVPPVQVQDHSTDVKVLAVHINGLSL